MNSCFLSTKNRKKILYILIVSAFAFFAYINNLGHDLAYDDHTYITENEFNRTYAFGELLARKIKSFEKSLNR